MIGVGSRRRRLAGAGGSSQSASGFSKCQRVRFSPQENASEATLTFCGRIAAFSGSGRSMGMALARIACIRLFPGGRFSVIAPG